MSQSNSPQIESAQNIARVPVFSNREIGRLLRSASRDFHAAIRILDSSRQSEAAGRLHALSVELRELAAATEAADIGNAWCGSEQTQYSE